MNKIKLEIDIDPHTERQHKLFAAAVSAFVLLIRNIHEYATESKVSEHIEGLSIK